MAAPLLLLAAWAAGAPVTPVGVAKVEEGRLIEAELESESEEEESEASFPLSVKQAAAVSGAACFAGESASTMTVRRAGDGAPRHPLEFEPAEGAPPPDGTVCLLLPPPLPSRVRLVAGRSETADCAPKLKAALARRGPLERCSVLARFPGLGRAGVSVAGAKGARTASVFFAADAGWVAAEDKPESAAGGWRVGDGGKFNFNDLGFEHAAADGGRVWLFYTWAGGEGINTFLLEREGAVLKPLFHDYEYAAGR